MRGGPKGSQAQRLIRALRKKDLSPLAIFAPYTLDIWAEWLDSFRIEYLYNAKLDIYVLGSNERKTTDVEWDATLRVIRNIVKKIPYVYNRGPFTRGFLFVDTTFNVLKWSLIPLFRYFLVLESDGNGFVPLRWIGISFDLQTGSGRFWLPMFPLANIGTGIKNGGITVLRDKQNRERLDRVTRYLQDYIVSPLVGLWRSRLQRLGVLLDSAVFIPSVAFVPVNVDR